MENKTINININSILGTLVIMGNDADAVRLSGKVERALIKVIESVQNNFTDCKIQVGEQIQDIQMQPQQDPENQGSGYPSPP